MYAVNLQQKPCCHGSDANISKFDVGKEHMTLKVNYQWAERHCVNEMLRYTAVFKINRKPESSNFSFRLVKFCPGLVNLNTTMKETCVTLEVWTS